MALKLKTSGKVFLIILALGVVYAGKVFWWDKRPQVAKASAEVGRVLLPDAPEASLTGANTVMRGLPTAVVLAADTLG
ncbi:MAG: hypothetical protein ABI876_07020, partial [Bacteroidota bacterium]